MGLYSQFNVRLFAGGVDLTGRSNKVEVATDTEELDVTTFKAEGDPDSGWKEFIPGLNSTAIMAEGFWEAGTTSKVDDSMWDGLGAIHAMTIGPVGAAVGDTAYLTQAMRAKYKLLGELGKAAPWTMSAAGSAPLARGKILNPPGTARTADGNGTAVELAAVGTGQTLYATLHVLSVAGTTPTVTVTIQSDTVEAFSGSPETRITFTTADEIGGQFTSDPGAHADTWYRAVFDVEGTDPSFLALVAVGIK